MTLESLKGKEVKVEQIKSTISTSERQKGTLKGLGLRRIGSKSEVKVTDAVLGMLKKVAHLVKVETK